MNTPDRDEHTGIETTGHEWDGIKELNNPLPRWWLIVFWASVLFSVGYWIVMPSWPAPPGTQGYAKGIAGNSQRLILAEDLKTLQTARAPFADRLAGASLQEIEADPELLQYALAAGASAFGNNCSTCHGAGAQGAPGYPNLNDDDWLWGGTLAEIRTTIEHGIRAGHEQTRFSQMPAFGRDGILSAAQIADLVDYVRALSGQDTNMEAVSRARPLFAEQCASCHGAEGKGDRMQGAPDLTDRIWLYGGERDALTQTIANARNSAMPNWSAKLDPSTIAALAVYVHQRGGGE